MNYLKIKPDAVQSTVEKEDVIIIYTTLGKFWLCDKNFKPQKLRDGRIKYRLATKK